MTACTTIECVALSIDILIGTIAFLFIDNVITVALDGTSQQENKLHSGVSTIRQFQLNRKIKETP